MTSPAGHEDGHTLKCCRYYQRCCRSQSRAPLSIVSSSTKKIGCFVIKLSRRAAKEISLCISEQEHLKEHGSRTTTLVMEWEWGEWRRRNPTRSAAKRCSCADDMLISVPTPRQEVFSKATQNMYAAEKGPIASQYKNLTTEVRDASDRMMGNSTQD